MSGPIGLSTEGSWECRFACWSILRQLASQSFLVCHPSCTVVPSHPTLIPSHSFPPCFLLVVPFEFGLCPVSPTFLSRTLAIHLPPSFSSHFDHSPSSIFFHFFPLFLSLTPVPLFSHPTLPSLSHGYFPLFPLSFHPLMHCLFLGTNLTRFVFSQTFRSPPANRPRTATN